MFIVIKGINKLKRKEKEGAPASPTDNALLLEIRDLLKNSFLFVKGGISPLFLFPKISINIAVFTKFVVNFKFSKNESRSRRSNGYGRNHYDEAFGRKKLSVDRAYSGSI